MVCEECGREFTEEEVEIELALSGFVGHEAQGIGELIGYDPGRCPDCWAPNWDLIK